MESVDTKVLVAVLAVLVVIVMMFEIKVTRQIRRFRRNVHLTNRALDDASKRRKGRQPHATRVPM